MSAPVHRHERAHRARGSFGCESRRRRRPPPRELEEGSRFILGRPVLVEYIDGVTKRVSKREAIRQLRALESSRVMRIEPDTEDDHRQARTLFTRYDDHQIDLTESLAFSMTNRLQLPDVFTFDSDFKVHGFVCYP